MKDRVIFWTPSVVALGLVVAVCTSVAVQERQHRNAALKDANPAVRADALRRLAREEGAAPLINALKDEDPDVRCTAAGRLGYIGSIGSERVKALVPLLEDDCAYVRQQAAWSLNDIGEWNDDPEARGMARNALNQWKAKRGQVRQ